MAIGLSVHDGSLGAPVYGVSLYPDCSLFATRKTKIMTINFEQSLDQNLQSALADEIVTTAAAVVSNAMAPEFAVRSLEQGISGKLSQDQRDAAAALQAYGVRCSGEVFTAALDVTAAERADTLKESLEKNSPDGTLAILDKQPEAAAAFKSRMCRAIAGKCAELVAADIDRLKKGKISILNEEDQQVFEQQHNEREQKQAAVARDFLSSLPERYPSYGVALFKDIREEVQHEMEEKYKSPDIHARIDSLFRDALDAMPPQARAHATLH